jgi:hypothetical protein
LSEDPCFLGILAFSNRPAWSLDGLPPLSHFFGQRAGEIEVKRTRKACPAIFSADAVSGFFALVLLVNSSGWHGKRNTQAAKPELG